MKKEKIEQVIQYIKDQTGYDLSNNVVPSSKRKFINFEFQHKIDFFDSQLVKALERIASPTGTIKDIQPNGYARIAIYV